MHAYYPLFGTEGCRLPMANRFGWISEAMYALISIWRQSDVQIMLALKKITSKRPPASSNNPLYGFVMPINMLRMKTTVLRKFR